jgi:hypothetical protein
MSDNKEKLTSDELTTIANAKNKAVLAETEAQKAVALSRLAESEANNIILQLYNKYGLRIGQDQVHQDGTIVRVEPTEQKTEETVVEETVEK